MSDSQEHSNILDSRRILHLPKWVRTLTISILSTMFIISILSSFTFLYNNYNGMITYSLAIAQGSSGAFLLVLILLYSQRDENVSGFIKSSDDFLAIHVKRSLSLISCPEESAQNFSVIESNKKDIFGRQYNLVSGHINLRIWIGVNVKKIFVIYFVKSDETEDFVEKLKRIYQFTFGGAQHVGFMSHYESAVVEGENIVSIWLTTPTSIDLLIDPREKLFWSQDIAMMTESFLRTSLRNGIVLETKACPAPL